MWISASCIVIVVSRSLVASVCKPVTCVIPVVIMLWNLTHVASKTIFLV